MTVATPLASTDDDRRAHTNEIVDRALRHLVDHDMAAFAHLFAPDGWIEFPFGTADFPPRIEGREAIAGYLAHYTEIVDVREVVSETRHQTGDPATVVVEFVSAGFAVETGNAFTMPYIAVISVGPEGIESYRDYWSPLKAAEAIGTTDLRDRADDGDA